MTNKFQIALTQAYANNTTIKKSALGAESFKMWKDTLENIKLSAYKIYELDHDAAGNPVYTADKAVREEYYDVLGVHMRKLVELLGEIEFVNGQSAPLQLNEELFSQAVKYSWGKTTEKSKALKDLEDKKYHIKEDLKLAQAEFDRYNYKGVNPDALAAKAKALKNCQAQLDDINAEISEAKKVPYAQKKSFCEATENSFRGTFELQLYNAMYAQKALTHEEFEAIKKADRQRKKDRKNARKAKNA